MLVSQDLTALVDLGSNSVRFMLVRIMPGAGYRVLLDERVQTRLGSGRDGILPEEAVARTVAAVRHFLADRRREGPVRPFGIATAAIRDAVNARELLDRLEFEAGLEVEVLSGDEEARLGALAARASLQLRDGVVVDLGGSSLQFSELRAGEPVPLGSVPLGVVRTTERFFESDPPTPDELGALRRTVRITTVDLMPPARGDEPLVAIGGTARALGRLTGREMGPPASPPSRVSRADLQTIRAHLAGLRLEERRQIPGLKPGRADVIVAGAVVLEELLRQGGYGALLVAEHGVRHGVLLRETFERVRT